MERYTTNRDGTVRDRITAPSINLPLSEEEAFQALLHETRRVLFDRQNVSTPPLSPTRTFTTDAGLGLTRTQQQADWLNEQQSLLRARLEDFLDQLDLEARLESRLESRL